jgi:uncharacterized membrane protein
MLAYFDPVWKVVQKPDTLQKVAVLLDVSSSMAVADSDEGTRAERAEAVLDELRSNLGDRLRLDAYEFDREVREPSGQPVDGAIRETDLGTCLLAMTQKPDISDHLGIVVVTDGGDELVQNVRLPAVPVYPCAIGTNPDGWDDVAIAQLDAPEVVERQADFTVAAEVVVRRASRNFAGYSESAEIVLEERVDDGWLVRSTEQVDLAGGRRHVEFETESPAEEGMQGYRVRIESIAGELSELNNHRAFSVGVGKEKLPVLLFAQEVGWDFSTLRRALARDPSVALTTLFRISEERFVVQDDRQEGDELLSAGFPSDKEVLDLYRCVIVGSFPASQWRPQQMQALLEYVRAGGAVVFLGGEWSFGQGRYGGTVLDPLMPWNLAGAGGELHTGRFAINVPPAVANHPVVSNIPEALAQEAGAMVESLNPTGRLKLGAVVLLETRIGGRTAPVIAMHRYGEGHCLAVATDTLWKWTRTSTALRESFSRLWRQAIRNVSRWDEGERFLSVRWDQPRYRPGERATAAITVAGRYDVGQLHFKATLDAGDGPQPLGVASVLGSENAFNAELVFARRGDYVFGLEAFVGEELLESYDKTFRVSPGLNEGANLEVDHAFLDYVATQTGGVHFREGETGKLVETLRGQAIEQAVTVDMPLVQYNYVYMCLLLGILALEWILRRRMNLF